MPLMMTRALSPHPITTFKMSNFSLLKSPRDVYKNSEFSLKRSCKTKKMQKSQKTRRFWHQLRKIKTVAIRIIIRLSWKFSKGHRQLHCQVVVVRSWLTNRGQLYKLCLTRTKTKLQLLPKANCSSPRIQWLNKLILRPCYLNSLWLLP